jgi:uncharacterized protein involved in response to NO
VRAARRDSRETLPLEPIRKVADGLLPDVLAKLLASVGRFGFLILILVMFVVSVIAKRAGTNFHVFDWLIGRPVSAVMGLVHNAEGERANPLP